ncbi:reticulon-4-interacting protein 1 homolog, mitochondrial [Achroia grisella]|uniref:reticulon-4-interacting protein 1 homolog, mitochondrial n=1 Tax=Achroia grisella TaxID=688607 RepID=UPI0027D2D31B|nr:reticulon-4-interacting protein 1 homolog, mitochondrial [Achroia grisella]
MEECAAAAARCVRGAGRMAAWRLHAYGAPHGLRLEAARVPPLRAPDELLVRVHAASLNPLDVAMIGGYGARVLNTLRALDGGDGVEFPLVTGRDFVGHVERAGAGARLRRGQRVWGVVPPHRAGCHADYVVVKDRWAGEAPSSLGVEAGGALFAALSASAALRAGGLRGLRGARGGGGAGGGGGGGPPRVLLLGLGAVGRAALQLLVYEGAQVVVGCSGDLCESALSLGAVAAFDRHAADYDHNVRDAGPYYAALDCAGVGGAGAGAAGGRRAARYVTLSSPLLRRTDARGVWCGAVRAAAELAAHNAGPAHVRWAFFSPAPDDVELLRRLAERGQFSVCVERVFPWWEAHAALQRAAAGSARGKLLLDFSALPPPHAQTTPPTHTHTHAHN